MITVEEAQAAGLSQEEVDAINGVDGDTDEAALAEIAGDEADSIDNQEDDNDASDESSDTDKENAAGEGDAGDGGSGDESSADDGGTAGTGADGADEGTNDGTAADLFAGIEPVAIAFVPKLSGELLPEFAKAVEDAYDAADTQLDAIEKRFLEGELDADQKRAEIRKVERGREEQIRKLNAASQNVEIEGQKWQAEQEAFFKDNQAYTGPLLFNALNAEVVRLAALPEAAGKSGLQILQAAKKSIDQQLAAITKAPAVQKQKPADSKPKARRPDVQTLGGVPAAAAADTGGDKWAWLDKLSGMQYEAALAKLSEADQAAYAASR